MRELKGVGNHRLLGGKLRLKDHRDIWGMTWKQLNIQVQISRKGQGWNIDREIISLGVRKATRPCEYERMSKENTK